MTPERNQFTDAMDLQSRYAAFVLKQFEHKGPTDEECEAKLRDEIATLVELKKIALPEKKAGICMELADKRIELRKLVRRRKDASHE